MNQIDPARTDPASHGEHSHAELDPVPLKDPVCGMSVTRRSAHSLQHDGKPFYFCSAGCKAKFTADPSRYLVAVSTQPSAAPAVVGFIVIRWFLTYLRRRPLWGFAIYCVVAAVVGLCLLALFPV